MHGNAYLIMWLSFFGLVSSLLFTGYTDGFISLQEIMRLDYTGTTVFIILYYIIGICFNISNIIWLHKISLSNAETLLRLENKIQGSYTKRKNIMYYFLGVLPVLGFIGTLIGFMLIATLFEHNIIGESDVTKIVGHILQSVGGIKTAAFTSIVGMIASWIILAPLDLIYRNGYIELIVEKVNSGEVQ